MHTSPISMKFMIAVRTATLLIIATVIAAPEQVFGADWSEVVKVTASDGAYGDRFGFGSIDTFEDTLIIGASGKLDETLDRGKDAGSAYIYDRNHLGADSWSEVVRLLPTVRGGFDRFGNSVGVYGDTAIVGAAGDRAAYIFERNEGGINNWGEVIKLAMPDSLISNGFGQSVAIHGDTIAIGAHWEDNPTSRGGAVYIFDRNEGGVDNWGEVTKLTPSDPFAEDWFGFSLAISDEALVVGAPQIILYNGGNGAGSAYVFERNQGGADNWGEVVKLRNSDSEDYDWFGRAVDISGDTIVAGAYADDDHGNESGAAYVFDRNQGGVGNWGETAKLTASDGSERAWFGRAVTVSDDSIMVGAFLADNDGLEMSGSAYLFDRNEGGAGDWGETNKFTPSDPAENNYFGGGVAISGETVVVGAHWNDEKGAAYVFDKLEPFRLSGAGQTYSESFDSIGTSKLLPRGWTADRGEGVMHLVDSLGLQDGPLGFHIDPADGIVNVGGNAARFTSTAPDTRMRTWQDDIDDSWAFDEADIRADNATDRAIGAARIEEDDAGLLTFEIEISDSPLRAFTLDWDLEIWGGDPEASYRGDDGGGFVAELSVGETSYYGATVSHVPGQLFDTEFDGGPLGVGNSTLIDGNIHSIRGNTSDIVEVNVVDGTIGNKVSLTFDANFGDNDKGWISAIDNVRLRALAPGDADANGVVDVADLLQLLGGQKFNQGVDGVTWAQGDFNADDQFNTGDLLAMLSFLSGRFPSDPYASEAIDAVADIIVNSETGEVTVDLAGHTVSAVIIESASEIFNGEQPAWDTTSQFPSTLPGELGNVLFTGTASGVDELGAVISAEFLGRDKEFYLEDLDLNILTASEGGALTKGNVIVVPEPSAWLPLGLGSLALVAVVRHRKA